MQKAIDTLKHLLLVLASSTFNALDILGMLMYNSDLSRQYMLHLCTDIQLTVFHAVHAEYVG